MIDCVQAEPCYNSFQNTTHPHGGAKEKGMGKLIQIWLATNKTHTTCALAISNQVT